MATLRQRNDPLRLMGKRIILVLLALAVVLGMWEVWGVWQKERESAQLNHDAEAQLSDLQARQASLQSQYDALQTERGMEAALRQQYGVGKPGEHMVVIVEPTVAAPVVASSSLLDWFKSVWSHL